MTILMSRNRLIATRINLLKELAEIDRAIREVSDAVVPTRRSSARAIVEWVVRRHPRGIATTLIVDEVSTFRRRLSRQSIYQALYRSSRVRHEGAQRSRRYFPC